MTTLRLGPLEALLREGLLDSYELRANKEGCTLELFASRHGVGFRASSKLRGEASPSRRDANEAIERQAGLWRINLYNLSRDEIEKAGVV